MKAEGITQGEHVAVLLGLQKVFANGSGSGWWWRSSSHPGLKEEACGRVPGTGETAGGLLTNPRREEF